MRSLLASLLTSLVAAAAHAAVDLTPIPSDHEEHGMKYRMLTFKYGDRKIEYVPPAAWAVRGAADRVTFAPPSSRFAEAQVQAVPLQAPVPLDDARVLALEQQAIRELPGGSQSPEVLERTPTPLALGDNPSYGFRLSYQNLGQTFHRTVIFVHAPEALLVFRFTAEKGEFEKLYGLFRQSLTTWHWTQPPAAK
jgi:hypothetical protein